MSDDPFKAALTSLSKKGLELVELSELNVDDYHLELLITAMENAKSRPKSLNLARNKITSASMPCLVAYLKSWPLYSVDLHANEIDDEGALQFLPLFEKESPITLLDLRSDACSFATATRLYYLSKGNNLPTDVRSALLTGKASHISFGGISFANLEKELLQYILLHVEGLESVDFSGVDLGAAGAIYVGSLVKQTRLTDIKFCRCSLTNESVIKFLEASDLVHNQYVRSLDFSGNTALSNDLVRVIISTLFDGNNNITSLNLNETSVTPTFRRQIESDCNLNQESPAIKRAVVALRNNSPEAREINLQWDAPLPMCMDYLADFLANSTVIERLNISNTLVEDSSMELMAKALEKNTSLKAIDVANCRITSAGIKALFTELQKGKCSVAEVNIANNNLDETSVPNITAALRANPKLTVLNVDVNPEISENSMREIAGLVMVNRAPAQVRAVLPVIENNDHNLNAIDFSGSDVSVNDDAVWLLSQALRLSSTVKSLNLSHSSFGDVGATFLADYLAGQCSVTNVNVSSCSIGNHGAYLICQAMTTNQSVQFLDLSNNVMDEEGVKLLPSILRENHTLLTVKLERTRVSPEFAERVKHASELNRESKAVKGVYYRLLDGDTTLRRIMLPGSPDREILDDQSVSAICSVLAGKTFVEMIDLSGNQIGLAGCKELAATLAMDTCKVRHLDLSNNPIDDYAVAELITCFPQSETLLELLLCDTNITSTGVEILARNLEKSNSIELISVSDDDKDVEIMGLLKRNLALNNGPVELKQLLLSIAAGEVVEEVNLNDLTEPSVDDTLCKILCASLLKCPKLRSIGLSHNSLTTVCVPYLTEVVEMCPELTSLDVSHNQISERGAQQLIACIERVSHLHSIQVAGNPFSSESHERISQLVALNLGSETLKSLLLTSSRGEELPEFIDLSGSVDSYQLTDKEMVVLAGLLRDSKDVRGLNLQNNSLTDEGCAALAGVLRVNHTLEALNLSGNPIGAKGGDALHFALKVNPQLQQLELKGTSIPPEIIEEITALLHVNQTPYHTSMDMRSVHVDELTDSVQFRSTDYHLTQMEVLKDEALEKCKSQDIKLIE